MVMTTGMIRPSWSFADVLALKALQKSMMLTPCGPSAVPTGGAGVAFPAGICSFTLPVTFFAMRNPLRAPRRPVWRGPVRASLYLFYLQKFQFDGSGTAENRDHDAQCSALRVDFIHFAREIRERTVHDADRIILLERHLGPRTFGRRGLAIQNGIHFVRAQRHWRIPAADESG